MPLCIPSRVSWDQETYLSSNSHSFCPFKQQDVYPDFSTHPPPSAMIQRKYHTAIQIRDFLALSISEPNLNSGVVKAVRIGYFFLFAALRPLFGPFRNIFVKSHLIIFPSAVLIKTKKLTEMLQFLNSWLSSKYIRHFRCHELSNVGNLFWLTRFAGPFFY